MAELARLPELTGEELDVLGLALALYSAHEEDQGQRRIAASLVTAVAEARYSLDRGGDDDT